MSDASSVSTGRCMHSRPATATTTLAVVYGVTWIGGRLSLFCTLAPYGFVDTAINGIIPNHRKIEGHVSNDKLWSCML